MGLHYCDWFFKNVLYKYCKKATQHASNTNNNRADVEKKNNLNNRKAAIVELAS